MNRYTRSAATVSIIAFVLVLLSTLGCFADATGSKSTLFPAYEVVDGIKKWGYINTQGKFAIKPVFDGAYDYQSNGLAIVVEKGKMGVIDGKGNLVIKTEYDYIKDYADNVAIASDSSGKNYVFDAKGKVRFETKDYIQDYSEGLAAFLRKVGDSEYRYGYVDKGGKVVVKPAYTYAHSFKNGKAFVKTVKGSYAIIGKDGKLIKNFSYSFIGTLSEGMMSYRDEKLNREGYIDQEGRVVVKAQYSYAGEFKDGYAIVALPKSAYELKYGVINKKGQYVIKPEHGGISYAGGGFFAVSLGSPGIPEYYTKKALFDKNGKRLTQYGYYYIGSLFNGMFPVSDSKQTYFINLKGERVKSMPVLTGAALTSFHGDIIKLAMGRSLVYANKTGKEIWKSKEQYSLSNGVSVKRKLHRPDFFMFVGYPEVSGLKDAKVQSIVNKALKDLFLKGNEASIQENGVYNEDVYIDFEVTQINQVLIVQKTGYVYPLGAAHGMPVLTYYHIDCSNGSFYSLKDLFIEGSGYEQQITNTLNDMRLQNIKLGNAYYLVDSIELIESDRDFVVDKESLTIYFHPYEIAPYAAGFPEFKITLIDLESLIDDQGSFWRALFEKK